MHEHLMDNNSHLENVESLFLIFNLMIDFMVYKQLSTQGTITEEPMGLKQTFSSALAVLGCYFLKFC